LAFSLFHLPSSNFGFSILDFGLGIKIPIPHLVAEAWGGMSPHGNAPERGDARLSVVFTSAGWWFKRKYAPAVSGYSLFVCAGLEPNTLLYRKGADTSNFCTKLIYFSFSRQDYIYIKYIKVIA
jgi:hypothetical protein